MNISATCAMSSLLVSLAASATGVIPDFDLGFTRSATETLQKLGINDACIIAAPHPAAFTYCREGSSTLWKYQVLDLEQEAEVLIRQKLFSTQSQRITVEQLNSAACEQDHLEPVIEPATGRGLVLGLLALLLFIGFRHARRL
ncbi:hypothetical protein ACYZTL_26440 [Pseudomonas sp. LB3P81]